MNWDVMGVVVDFSIEGNLVSEVNPHNLCIRVTLVHVLDVDKFFSRLETFDP